ncbi:MAG: ribosomal protein S18-alanine N-acetyltransferase [Candidatus Bathyarchaeota archaeon]|nr:ribosomal protein S18-alanine N-acetyltransferase [Candidatus Bathyarchaeota archaeon]
MAEVTVEETSIKHLDRLYEIEMECFEKEAFTRQQIAYLLTDYDSVSLIARVNGEIIGFTIGKICLDGKSAIGHILTIDVSPKHRRRGIGLKLLQNIEKMFKCKGVKVCCLEVREDNIAALNLYQKFGYKKVGRLENYYGNAHGAYLKKVLT